MLGDETEMELGKRTLKQNSSSAINHTYAKVRVTQKVPDRE